MKIRNTSLNLCYNGSLSMKHCFSYYTYTIPSKEQFLTVYTLRFYFIFTCKKKLIIIMRIRLNFGDIHEMLMNNFVFNYFF